MEMLGGVLVVPLRSCFGSEFGEEFDVAVEEVAGGLGGDAEGVLVVVDEEGVEDDLVS